jgi:hypothetical protein
MTDVKHDPKTDVKHADPLMPDKMAPAEVEPNKPYIVPILSELRPDKANIGDADLDLHVIGTGFTPNSMVTFNRMNLQTTLNSPTDVSAKVSVAGANVGANYVTVKDGTYEAAGLSFLVTAPLTPEAKAEKEARERQEAHNTPQTNLHPAAPPPPHKPTLSMKDAEDDEASHTGRSKR